MIEPPAICAQENMVPDLSGLPADRPTGQTGPIHVNLYVHSCLRTNGTGGLTPQEIQTMINTTVADFSSHDIVINAEICEDIVLDDPDDPHFESTEQRPFEDILFRYGCQTNGIDVFVLPDNFGNNAGLFGSSTAGGSALSIPSRALFLYGRIDCTFPALFQYQGLSDSVVGPHVATVPHFLSHELGHCFGLAHTHDDTSFYGPSPNLSFCVNNNCEFVTTLVPFPCFFSPQNDSFLLDITNFPNFGNPDFRDNIMAYTNYYDCSPLFTAAQGQRMYDFLVNHPELAQIAHAQINGDQVITQSVTWSAADFYPNGKVNINGSIIIKSGGSLTIESGVSVRFPEGEGITVEQGGIFTLNGYLGPACCAPWKGVTVLGTPGAVPGPATHGKFTGSGGVIEYAETGVASRDGGCVVTNNEMQFNNNGTGVFFGPFALHDDEYGYQSRLSNTTFTTNDYYHAVLPTLFPYVKSHVYVAQFRSQPVGQFEIPLEINFCKFQNNAWSARGTRFGILTFGSEQSIYQNHFSNLEVGIISNTLFGPVNQVTPTQINYNTFEKINIGIYNQSMPIEIHRNTFDLSDTYYLTSDIPNVSLVMADHYARFGVFATANTEFLNITNNEFIDNSAPSAVYPQVTRTGVYVQNLGSSSMILERENQFYNLSYGNIAEGINNGFGQSSILQTDFHYICNYNQGNKLYDFAVAQGGAIREIQGEVVSQFEPFTINPAKNNFSYIDQIPNQSDFLNLGQAIRYYYHPTGANQEPLDYSTNSIFKISVNGATEYCVLPIVDDTIRERVTEVQLNGLKSRYFSVQAQAEAIKTQFLQAAAIADTAAINALALPALVYRTQLDSAIYGIMRYYSQQEGTKDSLRLWISRYDRIEAEYLIALDYMEADEPEAADSILAMVAQKFSLNTLRQAELQALRVVLPHLAGKDLLHLDENTLQILANYDDPQYGYTCDLASAIRMANGIFTPIRFILPVGDGLESRRSEGAYPPHFTDSGFAFFPNPSNDMLTVKYPASEVDFKMEVYDLLGRLQQVDWLPNSSESKIIATAHWKEGWYSVRILCENKEMANTRILIKH